MNTEITETPINWIREQRSSIDMNFSIYPISEIYEEELYQRLVDSYLLVFEKIKLEKNGGAICNIFLKYELFGDRCEYLGNRMLGLSEVIEEIIEKFVADRGGYHQVQA